MDTNSDWSKLCPDVLRKILESESLKDPIDSYRAKTVCSDWYAVWRTCSNRPPCPWRIIHQGDSSIRGEDTRKISRLYDRQSYCMARSGNWLLMVGPSLKFNILNLLTRKTIELPSMESPILGGHVRFTPGNILPDCGYFIGPFGKDNVSNDADEWKNSFALMWMNEKTGDYVVAWTFRQQYLFITKKGNNSWYNLNLSGKSLGLFDMAFENSKLYMFTTDLQIKSFDFSGDIPTETITENPYRNHPFDFVEQRWEYIWKRKIAITKSGEVLVILSLKEMLYDKRFLFYIFKMNLESCKWERVHSIGDEMLIFGHGVTISPSLKDLGDGIKSDTICFVDDEVWLDHQDHDHCTSNCGVFDIATSRIEWRKKIYFYINRTQWLVLGGCY